MAAATLPSGSPGEVDATETEIERLASLSLLEYDRQRVEAAGVLEIRTETLDRLVRQKKRVIEEEGEISFEDPEPWPEPISLDAVLDELVKAFDDFVKLPDHAAVALALWVLHTYLFEQAAASPICAITSPEKRCGKTTLMAILLALAHRALLASNITPSVIFRVINKYSPCLLIDEADTFLDENEQLRGVINSGHTPAGAFVLRTEGDAHEVKRFSTWAPKAIALIGSLPGTIADRSINIQMRRKRPGETVKRMRDHGHEFVILRSKLAAIRAGVPSAAGASRPKIPEGLNDRAADSWEPLLQIADVAGERWFALATKAAEALSGDAEDDSIDVRLLQDVRQIFETRNLDRVHSDSLALYLADIEEAPWGEWNRGNPLTQKQLSERLRKFGVVSNTVRIGEGRRKGFKRAQFEDAFERYLAPARPDTPAEIGTSGQRSSSNGFRAFPGRDNSPVSRSENGLKTAPDNGCPDVTTKNAENPQGGEGIDADAILDNFRGRQ